ncbi:MAG: RNA polymerase sigma factor [Blastocatellia bacterium]
MNLSDEALVLACRRGDEAAWEMLVERFQRLIYAIARRAGLDEDAATDVFQNVFASLIERLDRIEQPGRIQAWLVTAAKRETWRAVLARNQSRAAGADEESEEDLLDRLPDQSLLPDELLLQLEKQHTVRTAVGSLDERCNRLLTLLFYRAEPPAYAEVASQLGISEGSIGPTRARCLQKLLRALKESGFV